MRAPMDVSPILDSLNDAQREAVTAPLGPLLPEWYWKVSGQPPIFEGKPGLTRIATSADFVWSIPFCAYDDTQNPVQPTPCGGK